MLIKMKVLREVSVRDTRLLSVYIRFTLEDFFSMTTPANELLLVSPSSIIMLLTDRMASSEKVRKDWEKVSSYEAYMAV
jgi:hypothetical protein